MDALQENSSPKFYINPCLPQPNLIFILRTFFHVTVVTLQIMITLMKITMMWQIPWPSHYYTNQRFIPAVIRKIPAAEIVY